MAIVCDNEAWFVTPAPEWVPPELAARIEALAPRPPTWLDDDRHRRCRWELCARTGAALALQQQQAEPGLTEAELRQFAWHSSRTLYESEIEMGTPAGPGA
jgi:hypothetical protein